MRYTKERLEKLTLSDTMNEISNVVYQATGLIEALEFTTDPETGKPKIWGNGHHIRQQIAALAAEVVKERWNDSND